MERFLAFLLLLAPGAFAQDASQLANFNEGRYELAVSQDRAPDTADVLAFKARSVLASGICDDGQPSNALLNKAERFARQALLKDPDHIEAQLQLAITLSLKARPLTNRQIMKTGFGDEARSLAKRVLKQDDRNAYAHGFMAVWHIEVVRRGGAIGSRMMGASVKKAHAHYDIARTESPKDAALHWQYARALTALNAKKYRREIETALSAATTVPLETHVEAVMGERAQTLQHLLEVSPYKDVEMWAEQTL